MEHLKCSLRFLRGGLVWFSEALRCMVRCYCFELWGGGWVGEALKGVVVLGEVHAHFCLLRLMSC